jgi:hypothetical protein
VYRLGFDGRPHVVDWLQTEFRDADKLEMLLQAVEYRDVGVRRVDGWIDSARRSLRTGTGQRIAEAAVTLSPLAWRDR